MKLTSSLVASVTQCLALVMLVVSRKMLLGLKMSHTHTHTNTHTHPPPPPRYVQQITQSLFSTLSFGPGSSASPALPTNQTSSFFSFFSPPPRKESSLPGEDTTVMRRNGDKKSAREVELFCGTIAAGP